MASHSADVMASMSGEAGLASNVTGGDVREEEQGGTETSYEQKVAVICILSVLSIFGTVGNGLVLYVFNSKGNKVTSTIFILALAWTDIFTCSVIIPLTIVLVARDSDLLGDFMCKMYHFCITFNVPLSAFIMVAIAVDRYFSICHPFMHAVTPKRARLTVFFLTIFAFSLGTVVALAYGYVIDPQSANVTAGSNHSAPASLTTLDPRSLRLWPPAGSTLKDVLAGDPAGQGENAVAAAVTMTSARQIFGVSTTTTTPTPIAAVSSSSSGVRRICLPTEDIIAMQFLEIYQKFYAGVFLVSLIAVLIIYALIYHSVVKRREWRRRQRSGRPASKSPLTQHTELEAETLELRTKNGAAPLAPAPLPSTNRGGSGNGGGVTLIVSTTGNGCCSEMQSLNSSEKKASKERRDFNFLANIRTAAMLFVVTLVFIICFLPSWLMAIKLFNFNAVVFYMYFLYNAANPVIYAFMNHAFRKELKRVFQRGLSICSS